MLRERDGEEGAVKGGAVHIRSEDDNRARAAAQASASKRARQKEQLLKAQSGKSRIVSTKPGEENPYVLNFRKNKATFLEIADEMDDMLVNNTPGTHVVKDYLDHKPYLHTAPRGRA